MNGRLAYCALVGVRRLREMMSNDVVLLVFPSFFRHFIDFRFKLLLTWFHFCIVLFIYWYRRNQWESKQLIVQWFRAVCGRCLIAGACGTCLATSAVISAAIGRDFLEATTLLHRRSGESPSPASACAPYRHLQPSRRQEFGLIAPDTELRWVFS